jgi:hypothetical protein
MLKVKNKLIHFLQILLKRINQETFNVVAVILLLLRGPVSKYLGSATSYKVFSGLILLILFFPYKKHWLIDLAWCIVLGDIIDRLMFGIGTITFVDLLGLGIFGLEQIFKKVLIKK